MDHAAMCAKIDGLGLPLVLCRSKSGGGHFFAFMEAPVHADTLRSRLAEWTALLGFASSTEQFPKQSERFDATDVGSWINLPYFGARETTRYGFKEGKPLALEDFLTYAESKRVPPDIMQKEWTPPAEDTLFPDGPPCLQILEKQGKFVDGTKNLGMMAVTTYHQKANPDHWVDKVVEYNQIIGGVENDELQNIIKSYRRKEYNYGCKKAPINSVCQRKACLLRKFGVSGGEGSGDEAIVEIGNITRYDHGPDDPEWGLELNGRRIVVSNGELASKDKFNLVCLARLSLLPVRQSQPRWTAYVATLVQGAEIVPAPEDAGPTGQFLEWIRSFCSDLPPAENWDGILNGCPYHEEGKTYFRSHDLFQYLDSRRVKYKDVQWVWRTLRSGGATKAQKTLRGQNNINLWCIETPEKPGGHAPSSDVPDFSTKEPF